ncbi:MAG: transporter substrate-binding domain-containing protein [Deltaproteobacteria bacterium]|nr:transporter substrate-binding domain-containing protein [Deltaproteobacteria bacterium]
MDLNFNKNITLRQIKARLLIMLVLLPVCIFLNPKNADARQQETASQTSANLLTQTEKAWLAEHPVIRVAMAPDWPPVEFADEHGEPSGISEDYLRLIEKRLGIKFKRAHGLSWQEAYTRMRRWEIDMTTCVAETPERTAFWAFTKPYMRIPILIVADRHVPYIADMRELAGRKVAVAEGYAVDEWIPRDFPDIDLVRVPGPLEGLEALRHGEVFAYIDAMLTIGHFLTLPRMGTLQIAGQTPYVNAQSMAVRKDWAILAGILDKALDSISETERMEIYRRWVPVYREIGPEYTLLWWIFGILAVILLVSAAWIWKLRREIAARKKAEAEASESEFLYKKLFEDHSAVKLLIEPDTANIVDANEAAEKFYGWPREKLTQMKITDINTLSPTEVRQEMEEARTSKKIYFEFRHRLADGSIRNVDVFSSKINIKGKEFLHSIIHDVTERRQAEEALRIKNLTFDTSIAANSIADAEGVIIEANNPFLTLWGYASKEEVVGNPISYFFKDADEASVIVASLNRDGHWQGSFTGKKKDGLTFICYGMATVIRDKNGNITGYQSSVLDVTKQMQSQEELKRLTQELEKRVEARTKELHKSQLALLNVVDDLNEKTQKLAAANESLEGLNKELEAFAYSVSHDLRAPLRSIDGFSMALLEDYADKIDKTGNDYLERVRRAAQNMGELIDDMLKLSRVSKADFRPEPLNLSEMVREISADCAKNAGGKTTHIKIEKEIIASGDRALLQIALTNLIDNAFKFSCKQNNPSIEFAAKQENETKIFYIRDNGTGFDMAYADKLFTPFQRLHTQEEFSGTGIGLATVQRIIHRHGGKIWAEGDINKGATFYFTLP